VQFYACLLLWTLAMSLIQYISGNEHKATKLGVIIFVGAIVIFTMLLAGHIEKITRSKIAVFFTYFLPFMSGIVLYRFISGQKLSTTIIGGTVIFVAVWALLVFLITQASEKSGG
jgi:hypothetical protein